MPGPVQNLNVEYIAELTNFNSESRMYYLIVNISWEAPSNPNGVILGYNYSLMETSNSNNVIIEYTNTALLSAELSVMVAPFTNYTATVVAYTSEGSGESAVQVVVSPEAGKFMFVVRFQFVGYQSPCGFSVINCFYFHDCAQINAVKRTSNKCREHSNEHDTKKGLCLLTASKRAPLQWSIASIDPPSPHACQLRNIRVLWDKYIMMIFAHPHSVCRGSV